MLLQSLCFMLKNPNPIPIPYTQNNTVKVCQAQHLHLRKSRWTHAKTYPLVIQQFASENDHVEIVNFPISMVDLSSFSSKRLHHFG